MNATQAHLRKPKILRAEADERLTALLKLPLDALLTPPEAALVLALAGPGTLSQWRHHHRYALKWVLCGTAIRYKLGDLLAFRDSRTSDGTIGPPAGMKVHPGGPGRGHRETAPKKQARRSA